MNYDPIPDFIKMRNKFPDAYKEVKQLIHAHPYPEGLHPAIIEKLNMSLEMLFWAGLSSGMDTFNTTNEN